ncbi:hypothetical protein SAMN05443668_102754 [Cryptosporangium aurantiacum]|uniref:Uncharacterized protein n=1 Tax=Cryptosporangium aurantiacum TaxID=134849 RepID=A0A1M7NQK5_9ACTN|nr:hypothetical protein SAMN05443668_102754 [Cryptosporangium aurantiacum]
MVDYGEVGRDQRLAQVAAERHPEAYAAQLPESWAGLSLGWFVGTLDQRVDPGRREDGLRGP